VDGRRLTAAVLVVLARLVAGWFLLCAVLTVIAIGLKLFGDLAWSTLGIWIGIDAALLAARWCLARLARRLKPATGARLN